MGRYIIVIVNRNHKNDICQGNERRRNKVEMYRYRTIQYTVVRYDTLLHKLNEKFRVIRYRYPSSEVIICTLQSHHCTSI